MYPSILLKKSSAIFPEIQKQDKIDSIKNNGLLSYTHSCESFLDILNIVFYRIKKKLNPDPSNDYDLKRFLNDSYWFRNISFLTFFSTDFYLLPCYRVCIFFLYYLSIPTY